MTGAPKTRFVSFYSYKGGVGRTLALANCARAMAQMGKTVAIIDLDLEAPGLAHFAPFRPKGEKAPRKGRPFPELPGFAEYIAECRHEGPPKRLTGYFHPCVGKPGDRGQVFLMPAGNRDGPVYRDILSFDWDRFYAEEDGYRIMENLRGHIAHNLGADEEYPISPDYVLIDARTGLSETGGIATHQLADLVVLLFSLNRQNLEGTVWVHDSLAELLDPPKMLLVVSPVPDLSETGKGTLLAERSDVIRKRLSKAVNPQQPVGLPYRSTLFYEEHIFVDGDQADFLDYDKPYRELLKSIRDALEDHGPYLDLTHLPAGAEHFLGRQPELDALDTAWSPDSGIAVVELIAPGGTGKTALVKRWLDALRTGGWGGAIQVFGWSFYSQGTGEDRQASEDRFLAAAIQWFGVQIEPSANPADKGRALADCLCRSRTLLILDGLEPLQYPPGPMAGALRVPGLKALLTQLSAAGHPGLCVVTSREWLQDLGEWVRDAANPHGAVLRIDLGNLSESDGAALLHARGATRAGAAPIGPDDAELRAASREMQGHALTLSLLGRYLARTKCGDIRQRDAVDLVRADRDARGHAAKVVAAYESWFAREGESRSRELAALRLLGFFDRPASAALLAALRAAPPISGLTEPLQDLDADAWSTTLANLADAGLVQPDRHTGALDAHPLVREHLAATLETSHPDAWREGHRRLYAWLKGSTPHRPDGLDGLQPLYQAITHGCQAGLWQETCDEIYIDRILRGTGIGDFYSINKLGAFGADLGAVACFFAEPWCRPAPDLKEAWQAWLLNEAATRLRALGRLAEALEPMRAGAEMAVRQEDWKNAAIYYSNLSELQLTLGRVLAAVAEARRSVEHSDRSDDAFWRMTTRTTLADALHQQGETREALDTLTEAERLQAEEQPQYPRLYSLRGFRYCDLLLAEAERACWLDAGGEGGGDPDLVGVCDAVTRRAEQTLNWAEMNNIDQLSPALDHLTLARCALYADRLQGRPPGPDAREHAEHALDRLRAAGQQDELPRGLLTRAWLRHALADPDAARTDLDEAQRIAARGGMALHLADIALTRARLFHDHTALAEARRLIEAHGYGRRLPELQDTEATAAGW